MGNSKLREILLDMDGVLVDFIGAACAAHNKDVTRDLPPGEFNLERAWGITPREFWKPLDYQGFWSSLQPTSEASQLVQLAVDAVGADNVAILTAPNQSLWCLQEKLQWVQKHFPFLAERVLVGKAKRFCSAPLRCLLDDKDENVREFRHAGGQAILVPRQWNSMYCLQNYVVECVKEELELLND